MTITYDNELEVSCIRGCLSRVIMSWMLAVKFVRIAVKLICFIKTIS